jgi:exopolysaccharide biosynthesis polyprenyl glycosylphosphotransferase
MIPVSSLIAAQLLISLDILAMLCAFGIATVLSNGQFDIDTLSQFFSVRIKIVNFVIMVGFAAFWKFIFTTFLLYESDLKRVQWDEINRIVKAVCLATAYLFILRFLFQIEMINNWTLIAFMVLSTLGTILGRMVCKFVVNGLSHENQHLRCALIVGTNERAVDFAKQLERSPKYGYRVLGFVDEDSTGRPGFSASGYSVVTKLKEFKEYIRHQTVDEVFMALPLKSYYSWAADIANDAAEQGIATRHVGELFTLEAPHKKTRHRLDGSSSAFDANPIGGWQILTKRLMDIVVSATLLLFLLPLSLLVSLMIKVSSPGPVFFIQTRIGLNKRRFKLIKFRSMYLDAEKKQAQLDRFNEASGPVFKIKNDPRVTWIGNIIRKTSIDELPQLINVLIGDMSLVGPRPLPIRDYNGFKKDWQRRRFSVKPGLTCLWQVNGRSDIPFDRWMELDLVYIDHWSLWLDVKILVLTIPAVLRCEGAA